MKIFRGVVLAGLVLSCAGCGPAPQTFHEERPAAEQRAAEPRSDERREERHERKERRREEREGRENGAAEGNDAAGTERAPREPTNGASVSLGGAYDLERDERRGGHTLDKHVGRGDEQLRERLAEEPDISAASTWTDVQTAEATVGEALKTDAARIADWRARGERRANLALHFDAGREIGRSMRHGSTASEPCTRAVIVLKADGSGGFFVLTTYPEAAR